MILVICINYEVIAKVSPIFYVIILVLLVGVLFTESVNGATSWFNIGEFSFQPSEFAKIFVILTFSYAITKIQERGRNEISRPTRLLLSLLIIAIPVLLIIKQPDYGTALAFLVATVFVLFAAGIKKRYIFGAVLLVIIAAPLLYFFVLPEHAKTRIDVFLNPNLDPRGAGYNVIQSKLAVGSGQLFGMGLLKGNQTQLGFLYPKTTDFIFSVIGEEMGFVVTAGIVIIYVILITKAVYIAKTAKDDLGSYIAMGIAGIFLFHMVENIGMTIGLLPITGVPLPFVSYGGSSLLTNLILIALLLNISGRRQKAIFVE
jgi:rod shape determining protein RodA